MSWLAVGALLAACGGGSQPEPGAPGNGSVVAPGGAASAPGTETPATVEQPGGAAIGDGCALLTVDQVAGALGEPVEPGVYAGMEGAPGCIWRASDANSEASVSFLIVTGEAYERDLYGQDTTDVSVAGADEAFAIASGVDAAAINVRAGNVRILMDADTRSDDTAAGDELVAALVRLAEIVVQQVR